jgi:hypothetical protein
MPVDEKYKNLTERALSEEKEKLEAQYDLLMNEREEQYAQFQSRWNEWSGKNELQNH